MPENGEDPRSYDPWRYRGEGPKSRDLSDEETRELAQMLLEARFKAMADPEIDFFRPNQKRNLDSNTWQEIFPGPGEAASSSLYSELFQKKKSQQVGARETANQFRGSTKHPLLDFLSFIFSSDKTQGQELEKTRAQLAAMLEMDNAK